MASDDDLVVLLRGTCPNGHEHDAICAPESLESHAGVPSRCWDGIKWPQPFRAPDVSEACLEDYVAEYVETITWAEMKRRWLRPTEGEP